MSFQEIKLIWDRIWFQPQSPASVCLYRILIGCIILLSSFLWLPDFYTWFGYDGIVSIQTMEQFHNSNRFSILMWLPPENIYPTVLYAVFFIAGLSFTIGFKSNFSALILFICLISFHHRNLLLFHSGDTLLRVSLFLLIFGPIGKMYSIDSWLASRRPGAQADLDCSPWVQNLLRFQVAIVYWHSTWAKMDGDTWWNGTAVYYASRMEDFHKFPVPIMFEHALGFQLATVFTLVVEFALWTLIWVKELRYYVLAAGVILHLGIDWTMSLPFFENLMIASYCVFLKPEDIENCVNFCRQFLGQYFKPARTKARSSGDCAESV
jgi:hypothetical protein